MLDRLLARGENLVRSAVRYAAGIAVILITAAPRQVSPTTLTRRRHALLFHKARAMIRVTGITAVAVLLAGCGDFVIGPGAADFETKLCGDYCLFRMSAHDVHVSPMSRGVDTPIIPAEVVELGHDQRFIVAKQSYLMRPSPGNPQDTPVSGVFNYWILDVTVPKTYGPLTEDAFQSKRNELGVPHDLTMKDVYSYRQ